MSAVKISVLIPAYNAENTIKRCIESIQGQSLKDYEVIVVNDGSTDNTESIVLKMCEEDHRIHVFSQSNSGVSAARNNAITYASGEYIVFMDADDYLEPGYIQTYYESAECHNADVVIGGCKIVNLDTSETTYLRIPVVGDITRTIWTSFAGDSSVFGYVWCKMMRTDLIKYNNIHFDESMNSQEDLRFNLDVYDCSKTIYGIDNTAYIYEYRKSNRNPDVIGYINNQLKLLEIIKTKGYLNSSVLSKIQNRLESYCFGYLLNSNDLPEAAKHLQCIHGLADTLSSIRIKNEKDYVCRLLSGRYDRLIVFHFALRRTIKRLLRRGGQ